MGDSPAPRCDVSCFARLGRAGAAVFAHDGYRDGSGTLELGSRHRTGWIFHHPDEPSLCRLHDGVFAFPAQRIGRAPNLLSAATLYIATVGVTYTLLLSHLFSFEGLPWLADRLLHYVIPLAFVAYWMIFVPKGTLRWTAPLVWLIYPLAYLAVSLVRGAHSGWYPYPFINVATLGYRACPAERARSDGHILCFRTRFGRLGQADGPSQ